MSDPPLKACHLCGIVTRLTFEHVPPKAAFNSESVRLAKILKHLEKGMIEDPEQLDSTVQRKGMGGYTLCSRCNNDTGSWYGKAYVSWAYQGMEYLQAGGSSLSIPFHIFPGRVAKQIVCMFASACGPGVFEKHREMRKFVLDRDSVGIPESIRIYCYMFDPNSSKSRQAGITGLISGSNTHVFAEISFPPFGYIMTFESSPVDPALLDITPFTHHSWRDFRSIHLTIPMREVHTYFPGDFRTAGQWADAVRRGRIEQIRRAIIASRALRVD